MTTLYIIFKYLTFPGAYLHAFWEQVSCKFFKIPVEKQKYLRLEESSGHIYHSLATKEGSAFFCATFAGFMNFITGIWCFLAGYFNLRYMGITIYDSKSIFFMSIALLYLGSSLLLNLFPLIEDIENFIYYAYKTPDFSINYARLPLRMLAFIPAIITKIGAYAEKYSVTYILFIAFLVYSFLPF